MSNHRRTVIRDIIVYVCGASVLAATAAAVDTWSTTKANAARIESMELSDRERTLQFNELDARLSTTNSDIASIRADLAWLVDYVRKNPSGRINQ